MASKIVRSVREVKDINKLSDFVTEENDLVSDTLGKVYVRTKNGFVEITQVFPDDFVETVYQEIERFNDDIEKMKVTDQAQYFKIETNESSIKQLQSDVTDLQNVDKEQNTKIEINETNISKINISDSGWQDLTLLNGVTPYSDPPQYKEVNINNTQLIYLRGSVKGLKGTKTVIATLPVEKELTNPHYFVQNMSKKKDQDGNSLTPFVRWTIQRSGDIVYEGCNVDKTLLDGTEWNPINTQYSN